MEDKRLFDVLLHDKKPSLYFENLKNEGKLESLYPDLYRLVGVEQNPLYHPEGDVFTHTMMVLDRAADLRDQARNPLALMLAALYHDTGKAAMTRMDRGKIRSIGHENVSKKLLRTFLDEHEISDEETRRQAVNHAALHMRPNMLARAGSRMRATDKLFTESLDPEDLILLAEADSTGRGGAQDYAPEREFLHQRLKNFKEKDKGQAK